MRVLVGPCRGLSDRAPALDAARALAGPGGSVVLLEDIGVANFSRRLSAAEVALLREALRTDASGAEDRVVGYVCGGVDVPCTGAADSTTGGVSRQPGIEVVAVTDHVNLTWRSPLTGPNDDSAGPRFPSLTGIYLPDLTAGRLSGCEGMIVRSGIVAGVFDPARLNAFETEAVEEHAYAAVSAELVPVVIVAAHLGLRIAAAVVIASSATEGVA